MKRRTFMMSLTFTTEKGTWCGHCPGWIRPWTNCAMLPVNKKRTVGRIICMECVALIQRKRIEHARSPEYDRADRIENGWPEIDLSYAVRSVAETEANHRRDAAIAAFND